MGEYADYEVERMMDNTDYLADVIDQRLRRNMTGKWGTKDGRILNIADMTDSHLRNAMALCERRGNTNKVREFKQEIERRESSVSSGGDDEN